MLRRAGDEDPEGFATIATLIQQACEGLPLAAELTRARHGYSWAQLAAPMGVSRQAAQQRFHVAPELADRRLVDEGIESTHVVDPVTEHDEWESTLIMLTTLQIGVDQ